MWNQWKESMNFQKARWWASRGYAGYHNWRLPTTEEAATLTLKDIQKFSTGITDGYQLWTGDIDSSDSRNAWVYSPSSGQFTSTAEHQYKQLWSVRVMIDGKVKSGAQ